MKLKIKERGFTMVELLVVIAIIGILASIALISYNSVQNKAKDKAIISEMTQLRTQGQVFYDDNTNSYTGFCADAGTTKISGSISAHGGATFNCDDVDDGWAAEVTLPGGDIYCVDSSSVSKVIAVTKGLDTTVCE